MRIISAIVNFHFSISKLNVIRYSDVLFWHPVFHSDYVLTCCNPGYGIHVKSTTLNVTNFYIQCSPFLAKSHSFTLFSRNFFLLENMVACFCWQFLIQSTAVWWNFQQPRIDELDCTSYVCVSNVWPQESGTLTHNRHNYYWRGKKEQLLLTMGVT